jgi:hypothetical protein
MPHFAKKLVDNHKTLVILSQKNNRKKVEEKNIFEVFSLKVFILTPGSGSGSVFGIRNRIRQPEEYGPHSDLAKYNTSKLF